MESDKEINHQNNLLVTLANEDYVDQAKQLFSSVYHNAGWDGDYMLLAYDIPEEKLEWFRKKGILIRKCEFIPYAQDLRNPKHPPLVFSKFYLFLPEFKQWTNIVYLDADIIVRGSLDGLTQIKGFAAPNAPNTSLKKEFRYSKEELYKELTKNYPLAGGAFNTGIFAFSTEVIKEDSFSKLVELLRRYGPLSIHAEEPILNLFFYKQWTKLPRIYNLYSFEMLYDCGIKPHKIKGIIIHFVGCDKPYHRPWEKQSPFYREWQDNLEKAELINLKSRPPASKEWTEKEIQRYVLYLKLRLAVYYIPRQIDRLIGLVGIFIKRHHPNLYYRLKKLKQG